MLRGMLLWIGMMLFGFLARDIVGEIPLWVNLKSGALVLAGTLIGGLLSIPVGGFRDFLRSIGASLKRRSADLDGLIRQVVGQARLHRLCDLRELSVRLRMVEDSFLRRGLRQVMDNGDRVQVEERMVKETTLHLSTLRSHLAAINHFTRLAPVFGFVGTIIGLINVLNHMGDASQIGQGMAISLLTTFYGLLLANFLFAPLAGKLRAHIDRETLRLNIVVDGVLAICDGRPALEIAHRLQSYIRTDDAAIASQGAGKPFSGFKWTEMIKQRGLAR